MMKETTQGLRGDADNDLPENTPLPDIWNNPVPGFIRVLRITRQFIF